MLFMHALFAVQERQLELINAMFSTVFRDFCHAVASNWDTILNCIETGTIPTLDGIDHVREHLKVSWCCAIAASISLFTKQQRYFKADAERAAELRTIDTKISGWFTKVWPGLNTAFAISSGQFVMAVPEVRVSVFQIR